MDIVWLAFGIGLVAGMRAVMPLALAAWGVKLNYLRLAGTPFAWVGSSVSVGIFTVLALGELVNDKLPKTPSRKIPPQFIARVVTGSCSGALIGLALSNPIVGAVAGAVGAVCGTLGFSWMRGKLAVLFGNDLPAALLEDVLAIVLGIAVITHV